jgi:glycosyltransferase 2 family protein
MSLCLQIVIVIWYFVIAISLEFPLSFVALLAIVPLLELLLMLPISVGGIGVREWAFTVPFVPFGLTATEALSYSLLSFLIGTIMTGLSGLAFLFEHTEQESTMPDRTVLTLEER